MQQRWTVLSFVSGLKQKGVSWVQDHYRFVFPSAIDLPIQQERIAILQARIRSLAFVLAFAVPAWGALDALVFPHDMWRPLLAARLLAGAAFASFLLLGKTFLKDRARSLGVIYFQLAIVFFIPILLYVFCHQLPDTVFDFNPFAIAIANSYRMLPFVILICIGFFPLALVESLSIAMPILTVYFMTDQAAAVTIMSPDLGRAWVMLVMAIVSVVISYSQLRMLIQLVGYASYDRLTDCLGRRSGEEILKALWSASLRKKTPLVVAFVDLDHFKQVNDRFGHHIGDRVLSNTALAIKRSIRTSDFVIRWGGEEFLVILPDANIENATAVFTRMMEKGFGARPDNSIQTVSIGIAERTNDAYESGDKIHVLIQVADERLYQAKTSGRCRAVGVTTILLG